MRFQAANQTLRHEVHQQHHADNADPLAYLLLTERGLHSSKYGLIIPPEHCGLQCTLETEAQDAEHAAHWKCSKG